MDQYLGNVIFQVRVAAAVNVTVFRVTAPCSLVEIDRPFTLLTVSVIRPMMKALSISETSFNFYEATPRSYPETAIFSV
jgi:hypothetical protein